MVDGIRVVPTGEKYVEGFHRCVDAVARERRYLAFVHAPPLEGTRAFALDAGLERIELEVFASNETAIKLYRRIGFAEEGVKRRARKIDDAYDDNIVMALLRPFAP